MDGAGSGPVVGEGSHAWSDRRQRGTLAGPGVRRELERPLTDWRMIAGVVDRLPALRSGRERQGAQSSQGATELVSPGPALGKMQGEAAGRAGEPSGEGEETPPQGLGGDQLLTETDAGGPAGQQLCWLSRKMGNFGGTRTTPCRVIFDHGV